MSDAETKIYYLMGPSGSGKDTLIAFIRKYCVEDISVPYRYITRARKPGETEQYHVLTKDAFDQKKAADLFVLDWSAYNCYYAYDQSCLRSLAEGKSVLFNGSRAYYSQAKSRFPAILQPVYLHISLETQKNRLLQRERENDDEMNMRLRRSQQFLLDEVEDVFVIDAEQSPSHVFHDFMSLHKTITKTDMPQLLSFD